MEGQALYGMVPKIEARCRQVLADARVPGAAIGIVEGQALKWFGGFGFADIASERRPDADTLFRVGSITKTFTAAAIMQLRDEGKLSLDAPIARYLPEFAAVKARFGGAEDATLRRLLTHHSGLVGEGPVNGWSSSDFPSIERIVASLGEAEIVIEPDTAMKYSNFAYALLGEVVSRVGGVPYVEYVRRNLLDPLGMSGSGFELSAAMRPKMATGYTISLYHDEPALSAHPLLGGMTSAGQLYSSVGDLARWISLQFRTAAPAREGAQVLKGASLRAMHQPHYLTPNWGEGYCLSWWATRRGENIFHHHGGGVHGFLSMAMFHKRTRLGAIVLTNATGHPAVNTAFELLEMLIPPALEAAAAARTLRKPVPTPEHYRRFVGAYRWPAMAGILRIAFRAGDLVILGAALPNQPPQPDVRLIPSADPLVFTVEAGRQAGEPLEFYLAPDGSVSGLTLARAFTHTKVPSLDAGEE